MEIHHRQEQNTCIISPIGNIALDGSEQLRKYVDPLCDEDKVRTILINLSQVSIIDSKGFGIFINILKKLQAQDKFLQLCGLNKNNFSSMTTLRLDTVIKIFKDEEEALSVIKN